MSKLRQSLPERTKLTENSAPGSQGRTRSRSSSLGYHTYTHGVQPRDERGSHGAKVRSSVKCLLQRRS